LTALTIMLAILLFVVGPLQAAGVVEEHHFAIAFGFVMLAAVFIVSGSPVALAAILAALALVIIATTLRLRQPSVIDIYLDATAWLIAGLTLSIVVARAVFAPGRVTFHRVIGAVVLYLNIGLNLRGAVLLCGASRAARIHRPWTASGQSRRCQQPDLLQFRDFDVRGLWRYRPAASICARSR
jgi:hypothetical protein